MFLKLSELLEWRAVAQVPHELAGRSATPRHGAMKPLPPPDATAAVAVGQEFNDWHVCTSYLPTGAVCL